MKKVCIYLIEFYQKNISKILVAKKYKMQILSNMFRIYKTSH